MDLSAEQSSFFERFLKDHPASGFRTRRISAWHFCYDQESADSLAELVLRGEKLATASAFWAYDNDPEGVPRPGDLSVITYFSGTPACLIETAAVQVVPFRKVSPEFARREGEGDKSLRYWKSVHKRFFSRELSKYGLRFSGNMLVVCEDFRVLGIAPKP